MKMKMSLENLIKNKKLHFVLKILLVAIVFLFIFSRLDFSKLKISLNSINLLFLALPIFLKVLGIFFSTFVLFFCIKAYKEDLTIKELFSIYWLSYFFNNLGLGSLGGDSFKWVKINRVINSKLKTTFIIISEKILGFSMLLSLVILTGGLIYFKRSLFWTMLSVPLSILIISLFFLVWGIFFKKSKIKKLNGFFSKIGKLDLLFKKENRNFILFGVIFSFFFYLATIFAFYFIVFSINSSVPLNISFFIIPLVILINSIPVSFQGLGIRELSISYLFVIFGYPLELGFLAGGILLIINLIISILSGLYYLSLNISLKKNPILLQSLKNY